MTWTGVYGLHLLLLEAPAPPAFGRCHGRRHFTVHASPSGHELHLTLATLPDRNRRDETLGFVKV